MSEKRDPLRPQTHDEWVSLWRSITSMSWDSCYEVLAAHGLRYPGHTLLELRREVSDLCIRNGVSRFTW